MGLLDEAIREHLDLKRRRGDDPGELARLEREALGPAVRQPERAAEEAGEPAEDAPQPAAAAVVEDAPPPAEDPGQETVVFDTAALEEEEAAPAPAPPAAEPEDALDEPPRPEPPARAAEPAPPAPPDTEERAPAPEPSREGEESPRGKEAEADDVLEETPEFLQETPDHDRLWFEQKPPRDFDFDG